MGALNTLHRRYSDLGLVESFTDIHSSESVR
jgi:hypothetical protein